jgi:two-component system alkaline phosphatase synthesis response regulator PhoP
MPGRVLIVDDEANIVISLEFLMEQAGYTVAVARTGEEALEQIDSFQPDLVLLDVMLPGISGFDILQRIRQHAALHEMAVIMLTAKGPRSRGDQGAGAWRQRVHHQALLDARSAGRGAPLLGTERRP